MAKPFTVRSVEAAQPNPDKRVEIPDGGLPGLYLAVQPTGRKTWVVRYRHEGKPKKLTLGRWPAIGLADARTLAREALFEVAMGEDPAGAKKAAKAAQSDDSRNVEKIIARYLREYAQRTRSFRQTKGLLEGRVVKAWRGRQIDSITRRDVSQLLDGIEGPAASNFTFRHVRRLFNWSVEVGILDASPCVGLKERHRIASRDRVLTEPELRAFWQATETLGFPFQHLFRLLALTAQRRGEVATMRWRDVPELDGPLPIWVIPAAIAKNGKEHSVPLSSQAVASLKLLRAQTPPELRKPEHFLFTTTGDTSVTGFSKAKRALDAQMRALLREDNPDLPSDELLRDWRTHDLRRTAASGMAALGVRIEITEAVLNHRSGTISGIVAVYQRYDFAPEKREAITQWADHLEKIISRASPQPLADSLKRDTIDRNVVQLSPAVQRS